MHNATTEIVVTKNIKRAHAPQLLVMLGIAFIVFLIDQYTKYLAIHHLGHERVIEVLPVFNLLLTFNSGAAFSFLSRSGGWGYVLLIAVAVVMCTLIIYWLLRLPKSHKLERIALAFILGGAIGNLFDRIQLGFVVDFIQLHWQQWAWPVFNMADTFICIGAVLFIFMLRK